MDVFPYPHACHPLESLDLDAYHLQRPSVRCAFLREDEISVLAHSTNSKSLKSSSRMRQLAGGVAPVIIAGLEIRPIRGR